MQYQIHIEGAAPSLQSLTDAFAEADPSSVVDLDSAGALVRISTLLRDPEILAACASVGWPVELRQIDLMASDCCGGCGG